MKKVVISRALLIMYVVPLSADHVNPVNNIYLGFKTVNIFESSSHKIAYGVDGLKPTYTRKCIRPYQNENVLIPDQFCDSYKAPADKTVHATFVHAETTEQFAASYSQSMEFDINISLMGGGVGVNLFDVGALKASFETQWAYEYYKDITLSAFIATGKTYCYEVTYSEFYQMDHADELKQLIMNAPLTYDATYYTKLYSVAGTHVQTGTVFGAATVEVAFAGEKTMEASFQTETSLEISAQENLWYVSATEKDTIHLSTDAQTYYKIVGSNYYVFYEGTAPTDNDQKKYNLDACTNPQPVKVKLTPIAYTVTKTNFPEMDEDSLNIIAINMIQGFVDYCSHYTCAQNPTPTVNPWESAQTVVGNNRKKLIREDEGLCVLSELRKLSYATCYLEIAAHEVGDTTRYWYVGGASTNSVVCSALCSKSIGGWLKNKGSALNARQYGSVAPGSEYKVPYLKTMTMEPAATSHCFLSRIDNENQCDDYCFVHRADGYFKLDIFVAASCHDEKHTNNKGQHGCYAMCVDTTETVDFTTKLSISPHDGEVPVALANETYCMINKQQLAGSFNSDVSTGGGCKLEQKLVGGREGVYWVFSAIRPTASIDEDWCYDECSVVYIFIY